MRIGCSWWGFAEELKECSGVDTPDGGRYTRPILMKELNEQGHELYTMQEQRGKNTLDFLVDTDGQEMPDLDALFIEWRWPTYKNNKNHPDFGERGYEPDLDRQCDIIDEYMGRIPIVIFDTDLKIHKKYNGNHKRYKNQKSNLEYSVIFEPSLRPNNFSRSLPYWSDFKKLFKSKQPKKKVVYLGSNYERYWAVEKYFLPAAKVLDDFEFHFFGNWLDYSPERPKQKEKVEEYSDHITFHGRNTMEEGFNILSEATTTIHIGKKKYMDSGVLTPRFLESIACGVPALVPGEFNGNPYGNGYKVKTSKEAINSILKLWENRDYRDKHVRSQESHINKEYPVHVKKSANKILRAIVELKYKMGV